MITGTTDLNIDHDCSRVTDPDMAPATAQVQTSTRPWVALQATLICVALWQHDPRTPTCLQVSGHTVGICTAFDGGGGTDIDADPE